MVKYGFIILLCLISGLLIYEWIDQGTKDRAYKRDIEELEREREELTGTVGELRDDITGLEDERDKLKEVDRKNREIIRRFENENSALRKNVAGFGEDIDELERLLSEFLVD